MEGGEWQGRKQEGAWWVHACGRERACMHACIMHVSARLQALACVLAGMPMCTCAHNPALPRWLS